LPRLGVQSAPVDFDLRRHIHELVEINRLDDVGVASEVISLLNFPKFGGGRQNYDWNRAIFRMAFEPAQDLQPIDFWQLQVEQNQNRDRLASLPPGNEGERLFA